MMQEEFLNSLGSLNCCGSIKKLNLFVVFFPVLFIMFANYEEARFICSSGQLNSIVNRRRRSGQISFLICQVDRTRKKVKTFPVIMNLAFVRMNFITFLSPATRIRRLHLNIRDISLLYAMLFRLVFLLCLEPVLSLFVRVPPQSYKKKRQ